MKKVFMICAMSLFLVAGTGALMPFSASADETHINVQVAPPEGMADEVLKLKKFDRKIEEEDRQRMEEQLKELSRDALRVGNVYAEQGEYEAAVQYLNKAIYLDPGNTKAHQRLLETTRMRDKKEKDYGDHYHKAMHYYRQGMTEKAIDELVTAIQENPDNEAARIKLNEIEADRR
ncbi:MAG: tetratricopeptide repeat protein [Thermodesulfobacteriota bacterium]